MTDFMLDLETWGTAPGCDLRSIGCVKFDISGDTVPLSNDVRTNYYAATHGGDKFGLTRHWETEKWWGEQNEEAQRAFANSINLHSALTALNGWMEAIEPDHKKIRVWAHGPHFDVGIINVAQVNSGTPPYWYYRSPRDTRTLLDAAGISDHSTFIDQFATEPDLIEHHALHDAIVQARAVQAAWKRLASPA